MYFVFCCCLSFICQYMSSCKSLIPRLESKRTWYEGLTACSLSGETRAFETVCPVKVVSVFLHWFRQGELRWTPFHFMFPVGAIVLCGVTCCRVCVGAIVSADDARSTFPPPIRYLVDGATFRKSLFLVSALTGMNFLGQSIVYRYSQRLI